MRDLSIIATPPARRLAVKTFVQEHTEASIKAILRELLRGGQVYFLHNEVDTIERAAENIRVLVPEARVAVAHGQMRKENLSKSCNSSITKNTMYWYVQQLSKLELMFQMPTLF